MHRVAVPATVVAGGWLVSTAPVGRDRVGAAVFVVGALLMFVASSLVHLRRWSIPVWEALFRFDHAAIFVLIAASATPIGVSVLEGRAATLLLWAVWIGAAIGVGLATVAVWRRAPFVVVVLVAMAATAVVRLVT